MRFARLLVLFAVCAIFLTPAFASDSSTNDKIFTISVAAPTLPKDVQVRYFLGGQFGQFFAATTATGKEDKIIIRTERESQVATSFRAIAYAPGCEFVTITVDDLASSNREAEFQCQKLPSTLLQGRISTAGFEGKDLQVEVLYECNWAAKFFNIGSGAVSPLVLTRVSVATDGTFAIDVPDFASDPLWSTFSQNAALVFALRDATTGNTLGTLVPPSDLATGTALKVASAYPGEMQFTLQTETTAKR